MNQSIRLYELPRSVDVLRAHLTATRLAIRPLALTAAVTVLGVTFYMVTYALRVGNGIPFIPEIAIAAAMFAPLLPIGVWRGDYRHRHSYLASLPVDRGRHLLLKVGAGWCWLMVLTGMFALWMLLLAKITGGSIGSSRIQMMIAGDAAHRSVEGASYVPRPSLTPPWQWLVLIVGPTVTYLFGSAIILGGRNAWRTLVAVAVLLAILFIADDEVVHMGGLAERAESIALIIGEGRYGLETLVAGRQGPIATIMDDDGERVRIWRETPFHVWLITFALWIVAASAAIGAATLSGRRG